MTGGKMGIDHKKEGQDIVDVKGKKIKLVWYPLKSQELYHQVPREYTCLSTEISYIWSRRLTTWVPVKLRVIKSGFICVMHFDGANDACGWKCRENLYRGNAETVASRMIKKHFT